MRKVFLDELPKWEDERYKGKINWRKSIGYSIPFIYEDIKGDIQIKKYENNYLYLQYNKMALAKISVGNFQKAKLGGILNKITNNFKIEIGHQFKDNKRDLIILDRKIIKKDYGYQIYNQKYYNYKCNKCGYDNGWVDESHLLQGQGCSCCDGRTVVEGINDIPTTAPWMVKYFQGGYDEAKKYSKGSNQKIVPICPDCGKVKDRDIMIYDIFNNHSIGCTCGDNESYPTKFAHALFKQLNVKFKTEYSPEWIKPKRYDFYFKMNNKKYIIEMDGGLGHGNKMHGYSKQTLEESKQIDQYKDEQAKLHNIEVIRIDCNYGHFYKLEYIKNNILNSRLNEIFDLSKIDWSNIEEFALSNLVKKVCDFKKENLDMTTSQIVNKMHLSRATVQRYLKLGTTIGWCNYNPKEEHDKEAKKFGKNGKQVEVFKNGKSLGIFPSCMELERQSKKLFGVTFCYSCISVSCKTQKLHKGFTFKYVEQDK